MYIELWVDCSLDQLGWFLNKKPPTEQELAEKKTIESFKKEFGQGRTTIGSFVQKPDGRIVYQIAIVNDYASFIKSCRDKGLGIYLSSKLMALCPYNLVGVKETLKSTMNNKLGEGWKAIEPSDKTIMTIDSGPWLFTIHRIQQFAEETGWDVTVEPSPLGDRFFRISTKDNLAQTIATFWNVANLFTRSFEPEVKFDRVKLWVADLAAAGLKLGNSRWCRRNRLVSPITHPIPDVAAQTASASENNTNVDKEDAEDGEDDGDNEVVDEENEEDPDSEEPKVVEEKPAPKEEPKTRLHDIRHQVILEHLTKILKDIPNPVIVELGCNNGTLSKKMADAFPTAKFILVDAGLYIYKNKPLMKARQYKGRIKFTQMNAMMPCGGLPGLIQQNNGCDVVVACEFIEHLPSPEDALRVYNLAKYYWGADHIVVTTPNRDYNVNIPEDRLSEWGTREDDHYFEFTEKECFEFVKRVDEEVKLQSHFVTIEPSVELQRSLMMISKNLEKRSTERFKEFVLPLKSAFNEVLTSTIFLTNQWKKVPYVGPTMAPVDADPNIADYLEHPKMAWEYFKNAGNQFVVAETKEMGSRLIVEVSTKEVSFFSRNGFKAKVSPDIVDTCQRMQGVIADLGIKRIVLDSESLPWNLLGEGLIEREFRLPCETALAFCRALYGEEDSRTQDVLKLQKVLSWYDKPEDEPSLAVFDVLDCEFEDGKIIDLTHPWKVKRELADKIIQKLGAKNIRMTTYRIVDLNNPEDCEAATNEWIKACETGAEGWVIKPLEFFTGHDERGVLPDTLFVTEGKSVPYMKVRGKPYLNIIYGIGYENALAELRQRKFHLKRKRKGSRDQYIAAYKLLKAHRNGKDEEVLRACATYYAVLNECKGIDPTL